MKNRLNNIADLLFGLVATGYALLEVPEAHSGGALPFVLVLLVGLFGLGLVSLGVYNLATQSRSQEVEDVLFTSPEQNMVAEFHQVFGHPVAEYPTLAEDQDELRIRLMQEELDEFKDAVKQKDFVKQADAIADLLYVTYGTAVVKGLDTNPLVAEAHRSNMSKLGEDGLPILADGSDPLVPKGKVLKGLGYFEADFAGEIERQRR